MNIKWLITDYEPMTVRNFIIEAFGGMGYQIMFIDIQESQKQKIQFFRVHYASRIKPEATYCMKFTLNSIIEMVAVKLISCDSNGCNIEAPLIWKPMDEISKHDVVTNMTKKMSMAYTSFEEIMRGKTAIITVFVEESEIEDVPERETRDK